ncbi:MAG: agmatinase [Bacillota bacterium]
MSQQPLENSRRTQIFMGATDDFGAARAVIYGAPMDWTASYRPGSRLGPARIREASYGIETFSWNSGRELFEVSFYDAGDLDLPFGNVQSSLETIRQAAGKLVAAGKIPIGLGGEHLVSLAMIEPVYRACPDLAVIHFDAHADLREDYYGEELSHATVMRRVASLLGPKNIFQAGIRSGTRQEYDYAVANTNLLRVPILEAVDRMLSLLAGRPVYITLDVDVVDPAYAPGTGTPEPGGCTSGEILEAVRRLGSGLNLVGLDLVEVLPAHDLSERTVILAAKILREVILSFA